MESWIRVAAQGLEFDFDKILDGEASEGSWHMASRIEIVLE